MILGGINPYIFAVAAGGGFPGTALSLTDDFDDNSKDTGKWAATTALPPWNFGTVGGTVAETGGQVTVTTTPSTATIEGYSSANTYDFSGGATVWVHLVTAGSDLVTSFGVWIGGGEYLYMSVSKVFGANSIQAYKQNYGNSESLWGSGGSVTYSSTDHAWLAIRYDNSDSTFKVYTAPDSSGSPGTAVLRGTSALSNFAVTALRTGFFAESSNASPGTSVFDGFTTTD